MTTKLFAYDRLIQQATSYVEGIVHSVKEDAPGDSPIEKLFYTALQTYVGVSGSFFDNACLIKDEDQLAKFKGYEWARRCLLLQSQVQLDDWRVDFLIHCWSWGAVADGEPGWISLIVECDGHDYHERTKEQAARDRARDRAVQAREFKVFRFTGSELWNDPWGCAEEVVQWAQEGTTF